MDRNHSPRTTTMAKRLLVTDDALIIREMIKDIALELGWEIVAEAANGQQAIDQFDRHRPDAVTMDLVMPDFDGLHGLKGILELDAKANVLVVSALDQSEVLRDAVRIGARDFIVKPFEKSRLASALTNLAGE